VKQQNTGHTNYRELLTKNRQQNRQLSTNFYRQQTRNSYTPQSIESVQGTTKLMTAIRQQDNKLEQTHDTNMI